MPGVLAWAVVAVIPAFLIIDFIGRAAIWRSPRSTEAAVATASVLTALTWITGLGAALLVSEAGDASLLVSLLVGGIHAIAMIFALGSIPSPVEDHEEAS